MIGLVSSLLMLFGIGIQSGCYDAKKKELDAAHAARVATRRHPMPMVTQVSPYLGDENRKGRSGRWDGETWGFYYSDTDSWAYLFKLRKGANRNSALTYYAHNYRKMSTGEWME